MPRKKGSKNPRAKGSSWTDKPLYEPAPPVELNPWYTETLQEQTDPKGSCVYLIEAGDHYKIGVTTNLRQRLAMVNGGLPHADAQVVAVRAGGRELERQLHDALDALRGKGEWFVKCEEVRDTFLAFSPEAAVSA